MPEALTWTTELPKEPGFYFMRNSYGHRYIMLLDYRWNPKRGLVIVSRMSFGDDTDKRPDLINEPLQSQWAGPILTPEEPEDPKEQSHA